MNGLIKLDRDVKTKGKEKKAAQCCYCGWWFGYRLAEISIFVNFVFVNVFLFSCEYGIDGYLALPLPICCDCTISMYTHSTH